MAAELIGRRKLVRGPVVAGLALHAGTMREELLNRDLSIVVTGGLRLEPRQVLLDRIVESQLALLPQLHDGDSGEQLAVRRHAELRGRRHRSLRLEVGE